MNSPDIRLVKAKRTVVAAEEILAKIMQEVQEECPHSLVAHHAVTSRDYCSEPRRICFNCLLEEVGTHWSYDPGYWSMQDREPALLGEKEDRLIVDMSKQGDAFWKIRKIL